MGSIAGRRARTAVHPEDGQQVTFRHRLADGTTRDVEISTRRIESAGRTLLRSVIHDVTERTRSAIVASSLWVRRRDEASTASSSCDAP